MKCVNKHRKLYQNPTTLITMWFTLWGMHGLHTQRKENIFQKHTNIIVNKYLLYNNVKLNYFPKSLYATTR